MNNTPKNRGIIDEGLWGDDMYYHGTDNDSADSIVNTQTMFPSVGDDQWLGDGLYFYAEEQYAFRWILMKYTDNFRNRFATDYSDIFKQYAIVSAQINIKPERLFATENIEHHLLFHKVKKELAQRAEMSEKYSDKKIVDGVVFNFLFKTMEFDKQYDAVKVIFPISETDGNSRINYLSEVQICVKNYDIVSDYKIHSADKSPEDYKDFITDYYYIKDFLRNSSKNKFNMYKKKQQNIKYT